jgi:hypothetical protein
LAEIDARRLTLLSGASLFEYCVKRLGLSEHQAYFRIAAARAARKFPIIFELLERRELHLTAVALLSRYLTHDNHVELLQEAKGKSKRQLLKVLARRWPKADFTSQVRRLPLEAMAAGPTGSLEYLSEHTHRLEVLLSTQQHDKLELARDLILHANPTGNLSVVLERALDLLIEQERKRQFAVLVRADAQRPPSRRARGDAKVREPEEKGEAVTMGKSTPRVDPRTGSLDETGPAAERTQGKFHDTAKPDEASQGAGKQSDADEPGTRDAPRAVDHPGGADGSGSADDTRGSDGLRPTDDLGRTDSLGRVDDVGTVDEHDSAKTRAKYPLQAAVASVRTELATGPGLRSGRRAHIPNEVRRGVLERDGFRCTYTSADGRRCECRRFLQIHHERAWSKGGPETLQNLRLLCAAHNRLLSELEFGEAPQTGS